jgi:hypothetical protein
LHAHACTQTLLKEIAFDELDIRHGELGRFEPRPEHSASWQQRNQYK